MATIDLDDVNFALQELVRLQLSGELAAEEAWRERQQLLDAVEANWDDVPEQLAQTNSAADAPTASDSDDERRPSSGQRLLSFVSTKLWSRLRELGLVWVLLGLTLATCFYVASL
ncbi:MAG: hypothetical protein KBT61_03655 [Paraperlucidibaca sp.]|jgi:hypothetical protein|nr:hypothetical protein [Paraperlucidibaca sp.]MBQ0722585.1 hypothetical protein [Paraperlucidibaca sp.]MBQ0842037.1 hypothetical protein [Paraperlucidibaca sp.]|tara:strand:+ start:1597 stop:1941 length:345 start_codon:yes stop_codon:yes gene_type:complete